jgi:hypothetical protein
MNRTRSKVTRTVRPGRPGTLKHVRRFGDLLVCVRYRYDEQRRARFTTAEVIVDERPWQGGVRIDLTLGHIEAPESVLVRVGFHETLLRARGRSAGGRWHPKWKAWELPLEVVKRMGMEGRIVFRSEQRPAP